MSPAVMSTMTPADRGNRTKTNPWGPDRRIRRTMAKVHRRNLARSAGSRIEAEAPAAPQASRPGAYRAAGSSAQRRVTNLLIHLRTLPTSNTHARS